ncbi:MAG: hypothetical protein AAF802_26490 [Planctomycetota bacterium]
MAEHSYRTVPNTKQEKVYRCKVVENTDAKLHIGSSHYNVHVRETSGSGFTLGLSPKIAKKVKLGRTYDLQYDGRKIQVTADSYGTSTGGEERLSAKTVREYEPKERWAFRLPFTRGAKVISHDSGINSGAVYGGFVLVLFCVMSLPGIGDHLGTAPRIETALKMMGDNIMDVVDTFRSK